MEFFFYIHCFSVLFHSKKKEKDCIGAWVAGCMIGNINHFFPPPVYIRYDDDDDDSFISIDCDKLDFTHNIWPFFFCCCCLKFYEFTNELSIDFFWD